MVYLYGIKTFGDVFTRRQLVTILTLCKYVRQAHEQMIEEGKDAFTAALEAGFTRFRPVLMTALAMIIGMVPMAMGLGEGGEQNAPLGRAVIGGLMFATVATLFFVPVFFSVVHGGPSNAAAESDE